jgi:Spy/CpxP family protein refolding chaperone
MNRNTVLMLVLSALLVGGLLSAPVAQAAPDTESEAYAQAPAAVDEDNPGDAPAPTWTCPRCGAVCPAPYGHRGRGYEGRRSGFRGQRGDFGRARGQGRAGRGVGMASDRMLRQAARLELTDEQTAQLEKLTYDTKSKLIDLEADMDKARLEMRRQMDSDTDDVAAMKKQLDSVAKIRVNIQTLKLQNWIDAKKVLSDEQKKLMGRNAPRFRMGL